MITRILSAVLLSVSFYAQQSSAQPAPELVQMRIDKIFIPNGFDSNDKAQVVIDSYLPNPCYKVGPHKVKIDNVNRVIRLEQWVYRYPGMICPQVIVPFSAVVDIGILDSNNYEVRDALNEVSLGAMAIKRTTGIGPDDYFYAPVADARIDNRKWEVVLEGAFSNECLKISEIRVYTDPKDVIIVLPILKPWQNSGVCKAGRFPFKFTARLPSLASGRYLLHVRSMNGQAVNKVINAEDRGT